MNTDISANYSKQKLSLLILPILLLLLIIIWLGVNRALTPDSYATIQKNIFLMLNSKLSLMPYLQYNLTQMGDAMIIFSLLSISFLYFPKMWEALIPASLISGILSRILKSFFIVPRPSVVFDNESFTIIGETIGGYASCPSGHSITIFTTITVLMFAFMPKLLKNKILWVCSLIAIGSILAISRVGVGAHHPLDVLLGSIIGYISGILGIFIINKYRIFTWITNKKLYPIFILTFLIFAIILIQKIVNNNQLIIFYLSLISLIVSIYAITKSYIQEIKK